MALQIIEPKRKTDNGHRVISRGLKLVTKQWMNHYEGWHDKHYFGALKCFFFIKRTNKRLSAKTLDTLVTLESAVIESLRGLCFGRYTWQGVIFLFYVLPYAEKK